MSEPNQVPANYVPQDKQVLFHQSLADEVFYGGAAGGGKSYALLYDGREFALRNPCIDAVLFRRTFPELEYYHIETSRREWSSKIGKYNAANHYWRFKNGSRLLFRALKDPGDEYQYQSAEFPWIGFDELTHFLEGQYTYLGSRNRSASLAPTVPRQMKSASNPGNIGHAWVKRRFVDPARPGEMFFREGSQGEMTSRIFIPAKIYDNPKLMEADPSYLDKLKALPENERRKLLGGDWDVLEGQGFPEWRRDSSPTKEAHVIDPFTLPKSWRIEMCEDWGYKRPFYLGWIAWDSDNRPWLVAEMYGCRFEMRGERGGEDKGVEMTPQDVVRAAHLLEKKRGWTGRVKRRVSDPSMWKEEGGESIAKLHTKAGFRGMTKGSHNRTQRKLVFHQALATDRHGSPLFHVFSNCKGFIRTFPMLIIDEDNPEDINSDGEDHPYDSVGMGLQSHRLPPTAPPQGPPRVEYRPRPVGQWRGEPVGAGSGGERPWMTV